MRLFRKLEMPLQGIPQCFPAMIESRLDHPVKKLYITAKICPPVAFQADDGGLHPGGRVEDLGWYPEQVFNIIPGLQKYRKNAIGLGSMGSPYPIRHLLLYHADYLVYDLPVCKDAEKDLAGDMVGKVTDNGGRPEQQGGNIIFQKIRVMNGSRSFRKLTKQVFTGLSVNLHQVDGLFQLKEIFAENTCTRTDLKNAFHLLVLEAVHDLPGDVFIF